MEEKRKYIRIEAPIVVTYKLDSQTQAIKKTITKDFSEGGMRFSMYEKLEVGYSLELDIETPFDTIPISVKAELVRIKALSAEEGREIYEVAVKFISIQSFDKKRMAQTAEEFLSMGKRYRAA